MKPGFVIGIMAAKGGLGVSTLAMNLAGSIHKQTDEYVILAELTPGHGDIGVYLGYSQIESLNTLLQRDARDINAEDVEEELIQHGSGIDLLLSSHNPLDADLNQAADQIEIIISHLSRLAPYTVLDMGVGLSKANQRIADMCNNILIVIEPTRHSIIQTEVLLKSLEKIGFKEEGIRIVLINRLRMEITFPASQVQSELGHNLSGVLTPAPELAYQAAFRHELIINQQPDSLTAQQFSKLANSVVNWKKESE
jgi:pilus assembly protein CpaE